MPFTGKKIMGLHAHINVLRNYFSLYARKADFSILHCLVMMLDLISISFYEI